MLSLSACSSAEHENIDQGMALIEQLDYENALPYFDAALVNGENSQLALRGQGLAYMGLSQYDMAAESLERALSYSDARLDQIDFDMNYYLATAYYRMGELDQARGVYEAIVTLRPKESTAYYLKGVVELEQGDPQSAQADFDKAVEISPTDYDLRINIFCSCADNGQQEMGNAYLQAVLDSDNKKLTDYNKGRMYFYLGDYAEARNSLEKAREGAGSEEVVSLLGQTYERLGDYNYAASVYSNYLASTPDAQIYNQLGLCQLRTRDYQAALNAFQAGMAIEGNEIMQVLRYNEIVAYEYLNLYPDDTKAQREYAFLQTR